MRDHERYMGIALELAREAALDGETPVGCIVVDPEGAVIGRGRNRREKGRDATAHAEIAAIAAACKEAGDWRLGGCSVYVTLEPCPMCAGAIMMSRISEVFYGAKDERTGSCGSVVNLFMEPYGAETRITGGLLAGECAELISEFFSNLRDD